jgi:hypothetical protein
MGHTKRRIKDSWEITKEAFELINWKNAIFAVPSMFIIVPFIWFAMLFEVYDEIDYAQKLMDREFEKHRIK